MTSVPWGLIGPTVILDSHAHTRFSDGASEPLEVARAAAANGCGALAITDHGDTAVRAATPAYFDAIDAARLAFPNLIIFAGMEWNIPPYKHREHVTILLDQMHERTLLPEFKTSFEKEAASASDALKWLASKISSPNQAVLIYNHPSRRDTDENENLKDIKGWQSHKLFAAFEGGPGHQRAANPGVYQGAFRTDNRWDPAVAKIGGAWDQLLAEGSDFWGAVAVSDYHNEQLDFAPCSFARTHVRVPQRDQQGVLAGLRAGSFWAAHGRILDELAFIAAVPGLPLPATPGESVKLSTTAGVVFRLQVRRSASTRGQPLIVELIGNTRTGSSESLVVAELKAEQDTFDWKPEALVSGKDGKSAYVRARVTAKDPAGALLMAYTNPIRLVLK
ncbi:MAG: CehA/McbA family metallohydrolase [Pseudomonadota bacterium]